jgi:hypothetical protein
MRVKHPHPNRPPVPASVRLLDKQVQGKLLRHPAIAGLAG